MIHYVDLVRSKRLHAPTTALCKHMWHWRSSPGICQKL